MRRLDKLIIKSFVGPFLLTTAVATFILLIQYMLKYFDDFVGKNLGVAVFGELIFYFSLNMLSVSLPLGVLVSSLMTFGNLGEHSELSAIKSSGISLLRTLRPIFIFVSFLSVGAFYFNNYIVPAANLKAYSLLYDIKHTKPALSITAGVFYNDIPNYSIYAKEKLPDNETLLDIKIYDHTRKVGNKTVILADSCKMSTFSDDRYLKLRLFDGQHYNEKRKTGSEIDQFFRTKFEEMELVFDLSSFAQKDTDEDLFRNNRQMKNIVELTSDIDSITKDISKSKVQFLQSSRGSLKYHLRPIYGTMDDVREEFGVEDNRVRKTKADTTRRKKPQVKKEATASFFPNWIFQQKEEKKKKPQKVYKVFKADSLPRLKSKIPQEVKKKPKQFEGSDYEHEEEYLVEREVRRELQVDSSLIAKEKEKPLKDKAIDSLTFDHLNDHYDKAYKKKELAEYALSQARSIKSQISTSQSRYVSLDSKRSKYIVTKYKKFSQAFACMVMFLIGAPLGAIIKKGGLGVPVIIGIFFFILYYVLTISSEKWAKAGVMDPYLSVWMADFILLPFGLFFLRQARIDARLFDVDFYNIWIDKLKLRFGGIFHSNKFKFGFK